MPESLTTATVATLGDGWVAWTPRRGTGATHLMRLADRRRYVVRVRGIATFTARHVWVGPYGSTRLSRVALPRR
ncbi:hypothetical protein LRS13_07005 [Svornostia abyssi]|uniref:Uncharacterized protein n=1 Tax=Svornostia abyssi TaxID=2898438 RepID=A0ABY5PKP2_9ACTN|nr:hypothetical protein LRS13_07005 [Parviterribacteraceae bacterium J379]